VVGQCSVGDVLGMLVFPDGFARDRVRFAGALVDPNGDNLASLVKDIDSIPSGHQ